MRKRAMKRWTDDPAKISGSPFSGPLRGKKYENIDLTEKLQVVEGANNSTFEGFGTAIINGKPEKGFYFQATRGSAQGIGWNGGMNIYGIPGTSDMYFAAANRVGILSASRIARQVLHLARRSPELQGPMGPAIKVARKILKVEAARARRNQRS